MAKKGQFAIRIEKGGIQQQQQHTPYFSAKCEITAFLSSVKEVNMMIWVYIVKCYDDSFYTGITSLPLERLKEHNEILGRHFLARKNKRPFKMFLIKEFIDRGEARKYESWLKTRSRNYKENLLLGLVGLVQLQISQNVVHVG